MKRWIGFLLVLCLLIPLCANAENGAQKTMSEWIDSAAFTMYDRDGMQIPLMTGENWETTDTYQGGYGKRSRFSDDQTHHIIYSEFMLKNLNTFYEDPEQALVCYNSTQVDGKVLETETTEIDGHPAIIVIYDQYKTNNNLFLAHCGVIFYVRQNRLLQVRVISQRDPNYYSYDPDMIATVSTADMRKIADMISYDVSKAPVTAEDVAVSVSAKDEPAMVVAGKSMELDAAFVNPEKARQQAASSTNYDRFSWYAIDTATGEKTDAVVFKANRIQFDKRPGVEKGRASLASAAKPNNHQKVQINGKLDRVIHAEIVAESDSFHTKASYPVTLLPKIKKFTVTPAKVSLYAGSEETVELQTAYQPEDIPMDGILWSASKADIVEVTPGENGTAIVKPLAKGSVKVTAVGADGKKAVATVSVVPPVTDVSLSFKGPARAGKKVNMKVTLIPKDAGVKDVEWSLDVDESIATVNKKGVVSIAKTAPVGTVITVTCTATGAPSPVTAQTTIEITE